MSSDYTVSKKQLTPPTHVWIPTLAQFPDQVDQLMGVFIFLRILIKYSNSLYEDLTLTSTTSAYERIYHCVTLTATRLCQRRSVVVGASLQRAHLVDCRAPVRRSVVCSSRIADLLLRKAQSRQRLQNTAILLENLPSAIDVST